MLTCAREMEQIILFIDKYWGVILYLFLGPSREILHGVQ